MKKLKLILSIIIFSMISLGASSQCPGTVKVTNQSTDDWNIRMYDGSILPVSAGASVIVSYPNGDPLTSVGAFTSASCDFTFSLTSERIMVNCASDPTRIFYKKFSSGTTVGCVGVVVSMEINIYN